MELSIAHFRNDMADTLHRAAHGSKRVIPARDGNPTAAPESIRDLKLLEEVAFKCGLSRNYISLLELDEKSPTIETLARISKALGVRASILIAAAEFR